MTRVRLDQFDARVGLNRGQPFLVEALWYVTKVLFFLSPWPWPSGLKIFLLRIFGASAGKGIVLRPRVNIHFPWKLTIGSHVWIGEETCILNLEPVKIGDQVCISQRVFLCTGNHDYRRPDFAYRNAPISLQDGCWIGAQTFVGPGVVVGEEAVVQAGSTVYHSVSSQTVVWGNPAINKKSRYHESE